MKKIALDAEVSLDDFWGCHVEDDGWIKDNMDKIKAPIFVKISDVSIYSKPETKSVEIVSIGFDKGILFDKLLAGKYQSSKPPIPTTFLLRLTESISPVLP